MNRIISFFTELPSWLQWAVIVFLAGVVGQFGKSLTLAIIGYIKKRKSTGGSSQVGKSIENNYKLKKKELKALAKLEKKKAKAREKEKK